MIIDTSYFINRLNLPQVGNTQGQEDVESFIAQYEPEYLRCVLGYSLSKAFNESIEGSGLPSEQRWIDLLQGAEFEYNGCTTYWPGFAPATGTKISPIANYIFYQYVDNKVSDFTLVGNVASTTDNNRTVNPVDRLVDTWNRMVDLNNLLYQFLKANQTTYPEWKTCNCDCGCGCDKHTPADCKHFFKKINSLDL